MSRTLPVELSQTGKRALSVGIIGGSGLALAGFEIWHTFRMQTLLGKGLMAVVPLGMALIIICASYWLSNAEFDGQTMLRITGWFIVGGIGMAVVAGWIVAHQVIRGVGFQHWHFMTVGTMTVGGVVGFLLGVFDTRSRRHRERAIEERKRVEAEQEKLTLLNRILRHNILNSVNVIQGWAETQKEHTPADEQKALDVITSRSADIVGLIEKVHTFIERVSTSGTHALEPVDLSAVLERETEKARQTYPNARFSTNATENVRVQADEMLSEVLENLLMNAVEHNDAQEPAVTVTLETQADGAVVSVADNGPGIPDDQKEQLFAWNPETTATPASGVGLSLVNTLVDQYGGSIWIEDNEPDGSIFRVLLRTPDEQPAATGDQGGQHASTTGSANETTGEATAAIEQD